MTKEEFLERAREKHGYKYQYPNLSNKITSNDYIDILYNDIMYKQKVVKHITLGRCPEKNTPTKTTEQFISEAKEIWGDKYDYSLVDYKGALNKVKIIYDDFIFEQIPSSHLKSAPEFNFGREYFIKKAIRKWGDKYDYSLVDYKNCKSKVIIILKETGELFEQTPTLHLSGSPENKIIKSDTSKFVNKSNKIHNFKYDYSKTKYTLSRNKILITCPKHGDFYQVANSHLRGMGCKRCGDLDKNRIYNKKYSTSDFIDEAKLRWGNRYDYSLVNYVNSKTKVKIIYDDIIYEQMPMNHLKYPPERFMDQEIFLIKAKRKWGDKYDYSLVEYKSTKETIKIIHNGIIYEQLPHNHLIYSPELRNKLSTYEFIKRSIEIHNSKYLYDKVVYESEKNKVTIICKIHGEFKQSASVHLRGSGCKKCSESFGEKIISNYLNMKNIKYIREHKFKDCFNTHPLRFDFYIPSMRTCIEFDGIQHHQPIEHFGGIESYNRLKINDKIKNDYCEENYINLVRIRYDQIDDIDQILWNNLKTFIRK